MNNPNLKNFIINKKDNLVAAWKKIDKNGKYTVFVVDDDQKLVGILTDGDIRRHLIKTEALNARVDEVMNKKFIWAHIKESKSKLTKKFNKKICIIPLLDDDFRIVDYFEYKINMHIPIAIPNLGGNEFKYLTDAFLSTWISSSGEYLRIFEDKFADYIGMKKGVAVSNGTVALHLALLALDIKGEDEVIVPDLTFAATINAVLHANATPVIVDIEKDSWCIDPAEIRKAITPRTKAIIPVHLYGQPCNMDEIMQIAREYNLKVIEDCAEAHGAEFNGQKAGSFGDISCFSFFANKIITTGEGGMCLSNDEKLVSKMQILRDHGMSRTKKYWHDCIGFNYRMTNLQAAIGLAQLERIDIILKEKEEIENLYRSILSSCTDIEFQKNDLNDRKKVTWMISVLYNKDKERLMKLLENNRIETRPFFYPLSSMPIYEQYTFSNKNSQSISKLGLNFPTNKAVDVELLEKIKEHIQSV